VAVFVPARGYSRTPISRRGNFDKIVWDADAGNCLPAVCGKADVRTIFDFEGHVSASQLVKFGLSNKLRGTKEARECLKGKKLLLLGDSTLGETAHDLAILLSGMARNRQRTEWYLSNATRLSTSVPRTYTLPTGDPESAAQSTNSDNGYLQYNGTKGYRNMTLFFPKAGIEVLSNFCLKHNF